jgi:hypothetical protein
MDTDAVFFRGPFFLALCTISNGNRALTGCAFLTSVAFLSLSIAPALGSADSGIAYPHSNRREARVLENLPGPSYFFLAVSTAVNLSNIHMHIEIFEYSYFIKMPYEYSYYLIMCHHAS